MGNEKEYRVVITLTQIQDINAENLMEAKERANELVEELPYEDYAEDIKVFKLSSEMNRKTQ